LQKKWWRVETRASEAKGPFPGGKRVGSWGKKRKQKESKRKKKETHPAQWDGLEGIEKRVGSWGKKKKIKQKKKAQGQQQRIYIRCSLRYLWERVSKSLPANFCPEDI
jgi:hypothetical protein